jgi:mono/diheme cytochrome c family protein
MKKMLKWTGIILGSLIILCLVTGLVLYPIGKNRLNRLYPDLPVMAFQIPTDAESIRHGKHISIIWSCTKCHGSELSGTLLRKDPISNAIPLLGEIPAPNLTPGKGGTGRQYTELDWIRAIRHGLKPNLQSIVFMNYSMMNDHDLGDLISYLKQIPPVDKEYPDPNYGPIIPIFYAFGVPASKSDQPPKEQGITVTSIPSSEYGKYLSATCSACHGSLVNNTLKNWSKEDFVRAFRKGIMPNGKSFGPTMSSETFQEFTDKELEALWLYYGKNKPL